MAITGGFGMTMDLERGTMRKWVMGSTDMSLLTTAYLLEKYGPLLTEHQVGEVLHMDENRVRNQRTWGTFPISPCKHGGKGLFHAADVAAHIDAMRHAVSAA